jgi:hypothetical protein
MDEFQTALETPPPPSSFASQMYSSWFKESAKPSYERSASRSQSGAVGLLSQLVASPVSPSMPSLAASSEASTDTVSEAKTPSRHGLLSSPTPSTALSPSVLDLKHAYSADTLFQQADAQAHGSPARHQRRTSSSQILNGGSEAGPSPQRMAPRTEREHATGSPVLDGHKQRSARDQLRSLMLARR